MKLRKFVVSFLACSIALSLAVGLTGCGAQKQGPVKEGSIVVGASPSPHAQIPRRRRSPVPERSPRITKLLSHC